MEGRRKGAVEKGGEVLGSSTSGRDVAGGRSQLAASALGALARAAETRRGGLGRESRALADLSAYIAAVIALAFCIHSTPLGCYSRLLQGMDTKHAQSTLVELIKS